MKRKIYFTALIPFYALIIVAGIRAGGSSHDECMECNSAIGKKVNMGVKPATGEKMHVAKHLSKSNTVKCQM